MQTGTVRYGHLRKWLNFDGVDDKLTVNSITNIKPPWTFIMFFRVDEEKINNLVTKKHDGANYAYQMYAYYKNSRIWTQVFKDADTRCSALDISCPPPHNDIFFAWTADNEAGRTTAFVNNVKKLDKEFYCDVIDANTPLQIGWHEDSGWYMHGNIYFVALYNRALSDAEISQMYDYVVNGKGEMITDGLVLWLDGDSIDIENGIWHDKSGNGNDGTIYGATYNSNWGTIKYGTIHYGV